MSRAMCDDESRCTAAPSYRERRAFLARLRRDPIFLLQHVPALWSAVLRRIRTRVSVALSGAHRARKRWPDWVGPRGSITLPPRARSTAEGRWPGYSLHAPPTAAERLGALQPPLRAPPQAAADPEDQMAQHRWGFLVTALFEQPVEWQRWLEHCMQWIDSNGDTNQYAWETYSAAERIANLAVFLAAMPLELRQRQLAQVLLQFLDQSLDWIYCRLEFYGPVDTNNHILNNARALVIGGVAAGNARAIDAGVRILRRWLPQLILDGGFVRERSSHYQLIVLNWLLDVAHFLAAHAGQHSADGQFICGYAVRMASAAAMLCDCDGRLLTLIGDVSPDAPPDLSLARLALLYPHSWPPPQATRPAVEIRDGWFGLWAGQERVLGNFPPGRFPARFPTHGHADFTSFAWIHGGVGILVDPGRYRYTPDPISLAQVSAPGHNLPTVMGLAPLCESLRVNGQWWPRPYADAQLRACEQDGAIVLVHNGFARATPVTRHERQILVQDGLLTVQDSLQGRGRVEVEWHWHFGSDFDCFDSGQMLASGRRGQVALMVEGLHTAPRVAAAAGATPGDWVSNHYGDKRPGLAVHLGWNIDLPAVVATRFKLNLLPSGECL